MIGQSTGQRPWGELRLRKSLVELSVWFVVAKMQESEIQVGWVAIYVDDFLSAGREGVPDVVYQRVNQVWEWWALERVSRAGPLVRFDGLELMWNAAGDSLYVGPPSNVENCFTLVSGLALTWRMLALDWRLLWSRSLERFFTLPMDC